MDQWAAGRIQDFTKNGGISIRPACRVRKRFTISGVVGASFALKIPYFKKSRAGLFSPRQDQPWNMAI
jgi:hypothetical protein